MQRENLDHRPVLDLTMSHKEFSHGDLTAYLTWVGPEAADSEPCIAITRRWRIGAAKPCVMALSAAYKWHYSPRYAAQMSLIFAKELGMEPTPSNARRIIDIIFEHIDDLVLTPPRPHRHQVVGGHAYISVDGEAPTYSEIVHEV